MKSRRIIAVYCLLASVVALNAQNQQKEYPKQEPMTPGMSEYWTPQPKIVTPGDVSKEEGALAPSDAIVLFNGKDLSAWTDGNGNAAQWIVKDNVFTVKPGTGIIKTRQEFGDFQLHIEWQIPEDVQGTSQGRGNSGVFLQGLYEIQILDCYNNETYVNGQTGSIYKQTPPLANAMRKPGEWNVYDIIYTAPTFKEDGTYRTYPYVTVMQNGILLQNHTMILGTTEYIGFPRVVKHGKGPIILQDHGNPISFRNVWIREL